MVKKVLNMKSCHGSKQGRPRMRWLQTVMNDLRQKEISDWKVKAREQPVEENCTPMDLNGLSMVNSMVKRKMLDRL